MVKNKKIVIAGGIVIAVVFLSILYAYWNNKDDGLLKLSGNVEVTEANVGFKVPGRIIELLADEGKVVKKGEPLARIDSAEMSAYAAQTKAVLDEASERLKEVKSGLRPQEVERARANVDLADADLSKAKKDFERAEILYRNGAISAAQYDSAKSGYDARRALQKSSTETLSLAKEGARREDIKAAGYRVAQARAAVAIAEERLKDTTIYAPFSGVILRKNVETGETVSPGIAVFTIGDIESPWVKVYVKEDRLTQIRLGQKAKVAVDLYPDKKRHYEGFVSYISSEAEFTPKSVQTAEERVKLVFAVKVKVKNEKWELKPGMPADVELLEKNK